VRPRPLYGLPRGPHWQCYGPGPCRFDHPIIDPADLAGGHTGKASKAVGQPPGNDLGGAAPQRRRKRKPGCQRACDANRAVALFIEVPLGKTDLGEAAQEPSLDIGPQRLYCVISKRRAAIPVGMENADAGIKPHL
jgi:hypothetical protein